jgi:hypothetical protein
MYVTKGKIYRRIHLFMINRCSITHRYREGIYGFLFLLRLNCVLSHYFASQFKAILGYLAVIKRLFLPSIKNHKLTQNNIGKILLNKVK